MSATERGIQSQKVVRTPETSQGPNYNVAPTQSITRPYETTFGEKLRLGVETLLRRTDAGIEAQLLSMGIDESALTSAERGRAMQKRIKEVPLTEIRRIGKTFSMRHAPAPLGFVLPLTEATNTSDVQYIASNPRTTPTQRPVSLPRPIPWRDKFTR